LFDYGEKKFILASFFPASAPLQKNLIKSKALSPKESILNG